jgi:hypothetical protein
MAVHFSRQISDYLSFPPGSMNFTIKESMTGKEIYPARTFLGRSNSAYTISINAVRNTCVSIRFQIFEPKTKSSS